VSSEIGWAGCQPLPVAMLTATPSTTDIPKKLLPTSGERPSAQRCPTGDLSGRPPCTRKSERHPTGRATPASLHLSSGADMIVAATTSGWRFAAPTPVAYIALAWLLSACSPLLGLDDYVISSGRSDSGTDRDSGTLLDSSAPRPFDASERTDATEPRTNATPDASANGSDGSVGVDSGRPIEDSGRPIEDGGRTVEDSGQPAQPERTCNPLQSQCGADEYCATDSCSRNGACMPRPSSSSKVHAPTCGCDGVTYWNRQHASWLGVASEATTGRCQFMARSCDPDNGSGCGSGQYCFRLWWRSGVGCGTSTAGAPTFSQCFSRPSTVDCASTPDGDGPSTCNGSCTNWCAVERDGIGRGSENCGA
jgi:hypothetical protein